MSKLHAACISHDSTSLKFSKNQKMEHITSTEGVPAIRRIILVHFLYREIHLRNYKPRTLQNMIKLHINISALFVTKVSKKIWTPK